MRAYMSTGSIIQVIGMVIFGVIFGLLSKFSCGRYLLLTYPNIFSFGHVSKEDLDEDDIKACNFTMHLKGKGWTEKLAEPTDTYTKQPDKEMHVKVKGQNVGYGATCVALLLSAKMLLAEKEKLPKESGIYTPAIAYSKTTLIEQLCKNNFTFEVVGAKEETNEE